jgi:histidinol dehydrogenase
VIPILVWSELSEAERRTALARPGETAREELLADVRRIVERVRREGDMALRALTLELDGAALEAFAVDRAEFAAAEAALTPAARRALETAAENLRRFHRAQVRGPLAVETVPGVRCELVTRPIPRVGLYVPAGSAPLPSTALMLGVPAELAGVPLRILVTPPRRDGRADPAVLVAARLTGIERVFKLGGAQAIAALAYGTSSVPKVDKIFGPGNAWVAAAKSLVASDPGGAAIDLPAGPSEVLVIADALARADFVASDLLAQAEHGPDAQAVLVTPSVELARAVREELLRQAVILPRRAILERSLGAARILVVPDLDAAFEVSNDYAPEHLVLELADARAWLPRVVNAGGVFLGAFTPEPMGDYCSGTNHVLPTGGFARAWSGLGLADFTKRIGVQELSADGLRALGPTAIELARLEGLTAHARAVEVRLAALAALAAEESA